LRIALVRQRYNPYGGAERFAARALGALAARGVSSAVVTRDWAGAETAEGYEVIRVAPFHVGRWWRDRGFAAAVCARLARESFDLVQSHERLACCDVYRAGDGVHRVWLDRRGEAGGVLVRLGQALSPYHRYVLAAERRMYASPRLAAVICNSRMVAREIGAHFGVPAARLHVIYNGVDLERFHPGLAAEHRHALRTRLGIADGAFVYLHVGSGYARKGVARTLHALAALDDRRAHLVVVGRDRDEPALQRLAGRLGLGARVHFAGAQDDVRPWYGTADALVLATLYDPMPNAAVEALACGLPVVVTEQCGAAELVMPGASGEVCDVFDAAALVRAMAAVRAGDRAARRHAARTAVAALGLDAMGAKLVALYEALLAAPLTRVAQGRRV
jgi:UDP-glucose:(heptosyl)LPS alpha-1,3-glucosyltransferase